MNTPAHKIMRVLNLYSKDILIEAIMQRADALLAELYLCHPNMVYRCSVAELITTMIVKDCPLEVCQANCRDFEYMLSNEPQSTGRTAFYPVAETFCTGCTSFKKHLIDPEIDRGVIWCAKDHDRVKHWNELCTRMSELHHLSGIKYPPYFAQAFVDWRMSHRG